MIDRSPMRLKNGLKCSGENRWMKGQIKKSDNIILLQHATSGILFKGVLFNGDSE